MQISRQFSRSDAGFYDVQFLNPNGKGISVDFDENFFIEFRDYEDNLRFTATPTSTPPIQVGTNAAGPYYYVVGLDLRNWAFGAVKASSYAYVDSSPWDSYPQIEYPAFTIVADRIPLSLQRDENLHAILKDTTRNIILVTIDPVTGYRTEAASFTFSLFDGNDQEVLSDQWPNPTSVTIAERDSGVYAISLDSSVYSDPEYLMNFDIEINTGLSFMRNKVVRIVPATYFKYAAILRNQVDKANKLLQSQLQIGYTDPQLVTWLDLGAHLINVIPPYTSFTVLTFPFAAYGKMLLDAATIAALESQGLFAIDTDFDYSLGGNALVLDHYTKISGFLDYLVSRLNENLGKFKQLFRTKGGTMVQTQYGYGFGRFLSVVPPGFFSRFGLQVGSGVGAIGSMGSYP